MLADVKNGFNEKAKKSIDSFVEQVKKIRTGRATPSVLDNVMVDYYGTPTPLPQTANVTCPEAGRASSPSVIPTAVKARPWASSANSRPTV